MRSFSLLLTVIIGTLSIAAWSRLSSRLLSTLKREQLVLNPFLPSFGQESAEDNSYICQDGDRGVLCKQGLTVQGCVCTAPDQCNYTWVNRCTDCANDTVYSVAEKQHCNETDTRYLCPNSGSLDQKDCEDAWTRGCLCYSNGTCEHSWVNQCGSCQNPDVFSIDNFKTCPGVEYKENECHIQNPLFRIGIVCPFISTLSCVCYTNGTCEERDTSRCVICGETFVMTFAEGKKCNGEDFNYWVPKRCDIDTTTEQCSDEQELSCACYNNGTCSEISSNSCQACSIEGVVSFNRGERCPEFSEKIHVCPFKSFESEENTEAVECENGFEEYCVCSRDNKCQHQRVFGCDACVDEDVVMVSKDECGLFKKEDN